MSGVLGYSALNKIKKTLDTEFGEKNDVSIISKEVILDNNDLLGGNNKEIIIANLPENCVLMHSSLNVTIPFNTSGGGTSPKFSLGLGSEDIDSSNYPTDRNFKHLIFDQYTLDAPIETEYQGAISGSADKILNENINTLTARFKMQGAWSVGGNLSQSRYVASGAGSQSAGLVAGGYADAYLSSTEEYNGSAWSAGGTLTYASYYSGSCGTQTSGLKFGGRRSGVDPIGATEEYNGTSWTFTVSLNVARRGLAGAGTQNAALGFAGYDNVIERAETEEYNGAVWTMAPYLNSAVREQAGAGTQTAALSSNGTDGSDRVLTTEEYNGTSWVIGNNTNVGRNDLSGCGLQTAALNFAGSTGAHSDVTEEYDGTNWSVTNSINTARVYTAGAGSQSGALCIAGYTTSSLGTTITEEYDPTNLSVLTQGSLTLYVTYTHR